MNPRITPHKLPGRSRMPPKYGRGNRHTPDWTLPILGDTWTAEMSKILESLRMLVCQILPKRLKPWAYCSNGKLFFPDKLAWLLESLRCRIIRRKPQAWGTFSPKVFWSDPLCLNPHTTGFPAERPCMGNALEQQMNSRQRRR